MPRHYKNTKLDSIIEEIIVPDDSGYSGYSYPHIKLRQSEVKLQLDELSFEPLEEDSAIYVVKNKEYYFGNLITTLVSFEERGLIDNSFKESIILNEKSLFQKQMQKLVNRRIYEHPRSEGSLIEAVIIQRHGSTDSAFLSYKQENQEELFRVCELHHLGLDKMPSSVFENYAVIFGAENLTPTMALEGIKRAGLIDDEFKEFIISQEQQIPRELEEKAVNEEEMARRFDCRYPVMADYVLTSNHRFYQPKEMEVPAKYSDTLSPTNSNSI
ncbi:hypothetical protein [Legionella micdadei]|uniref:Uncharacterized protein n=1 Tax=Legionella micdadei TaxID=451 RepID=A0A098GIH1_LEGMI|nr:hypothetical protein [Legionella micdadei]ARG97270.1 hypothetical protein B6N58_06120 [Legionella micdadei]KTD28146.1 hypothetical protein Lmic_1257 [Legionella micdadei]NSL16776.1 hypothetical protein [Legionella micdadei]CEG61271.1 protein of unknown function [Legionella micdadei]SCY34390.1 hypothetical protein SAMN02982997_01481 [Legionella micdadei]